MICNCNGALGITIYLCNPVQGTNFVSYPSSYDVAPLARYGLCRIIFPEAIDVDTPVSLVTDYSNTIVFKTDGKPLLGSEVKTGIPSQIVFDRDVGGYVISGYVPFKPPVPTTSKPAPKEVTPSPVILNPPKPSTEKPKIQ